ncbi:MAG: hypothetical protein PHY80_02480 [Rickettsiales bacterium]|nr:hypothetical protein [Rickettsiales bacterium]
MGYFLETFFNIKKQNKTFKIILPMGKVDGVNYRNEIKFSLRAFVISNDLAEAYGYNGLLTIQKAVRADSVS